MSEYALLKSRIGQVGADRLVALGLIESAGHSQYALDFASPAISRSPPASLLKIPVSQQSQLGQFMTPDGIAAFMAGLFSDRFAQFTRLLDAGAGCGALTLAFLSHWNNRCPDGKIECHAFEMDSALIHDLKATLPASSVDNRTNTTIVEGDFIEHAAAMIRLERGPRFTHVILNPPYKKIGSHSAHRALLRSVKLETVNLYAGFVGLAVDLMEARGNLVAIIPRSFCNGPYYRPFRHFILGKTSIRQIHLFDSRTKAFKRDGVLQENVIIHLERGEQQGQVKISTSSDGLFSDYAEALHDFENIVFPKDADFFIHVPTRANAAKTRHTPFRHRLEDIGLSVSTGPVVDFRMKKDLCANPEPGTVPLLYPGHFIDSVVVWPRPGFKKSNAIRHNTATEKWLFPNGFYAVTRRFSSKEERRRIIASVVNPETLGGSMIGFENHLNVIHERRQPLPENIARGICVYLNSTCVDDHFREFNGHTQVNATDLKKMPFPNREALTSLGAWSKSHPRPDQGAIDARVRALA